MTAWLKMVGMWRNPTPPRPAPWWAENLLKQVNLLNRKVNTIMAVDTQVVARLVAGAQALADQSKKVAAERDALRAALDSERAAEALEDRDEAAATDAINQAADAVLALVQGPETPDVAEVPVEQVPAVVDGSQPVVDTSGNEVAADEPQTGGTPGSTL